MSLLTLTLDCELMVGTQTFIFGHPMCGTMGAMLSITIRSLSALFFLKEGNKAVISYVDRVSRPHLTYKVQTIFILCLSLL